MIDAILSMLALAGLIVFLFILAWWVREVDLTIVILIGIAMAAYDFWRSVFRRRNNNNNRQAAPK